MSPSWDHCRLILCSLGTQTFLLSQCSYLFSWLLGSEDLCFWCNWFWALLGLLFFTSCMSLFIVFWGMFLSSVMTSARSRLNKSWPCPHAMPTFVLPQDFIIQSVVMQNSSSVRSQLSFTALSVYNYCYLVVHPYRLLHISAHGLDKYT